MWDPHNCNNEDHSTVHWDVIVVIFGVYMAIFQNVFLLNYLSVYRLILIMDPNLTFRGQCIVIYSYNKTNDMYQFLKFIFGIELYMFPTVSLSIIRNLALYTQQ